MFKSNALSIYQYSRMIKYIIIYDIIIYYQKKYNNLK